MVNGYSRWRRSLLARTGAKRLAFLGNFEAEDSWNEARPGLPRLTGVSANDIVSRMGELALWLAAPEDVVILPREIHPAFAEYLRTAQLVAADVMVVGEAARSSLTGPPAGAHLSDTALVPMGTTREVELLAASLGVPVAAPSSVVHARVNTKVFSARLCEELGIHRPDSRVTHSPAELLGCLNDLLRSHARVCVKEPLGVSGRGIVVVSSPDEASRLVRLLSRTHGDEGAVTFVVEEWIEKAEDVNLQVLIDEAGETEFLGARTAIVDKGVHQGHWAPGRLSSDSLERLTQPALEIARHLATEEGFYGIVGLDALVTGGGAVYPCLEINARLNMSSFQNRILQEFLPAGGAAKFFHVAPADEDVPTIFDKLDRVLYRRGATEGVLVMATATALSKRDRRLYLASLAPTPERADGLHTMVKDLLR